MNWFEPIFFSMKWYFSLRVQSVYSSLEIPVVSRRDNFTITDKISVCFIKGVYSSKVDIIPIEFWIVFFSNGTISSDNWIFRHFQAQLLSSFCSVQRVLSIKCFIKNIFSFFCNIMIITWLIIWSMGFSIETMVNEFFLIIPFS